GRRREPVPVHRLPDHRRGHRRLRHRPARPRGRGRRGRRGGTMQLTNAVPVNAAPDAVFALLSDVQRVASCMPGAALEGRDGDSWRGTVKVKVGPITAAYAGTVRFLEVDPDKRVLRVHAN